MGGFDIDSLLREVRTIMAGMDLSQFLGIFIAVVLGGFVLYILVAIINGVLNFLAVVLLLAIAYALYQYADSIPVIFSIQQGIQSLWPGFPPLRYVLPAMVTLFAISVLIRRSRE